MKIYKILNNNAVLSKSEDNREVIVTGKGIAFRKKTGDDIIVDASCKVFVPKDDEMAQRYQQLVSEIPIEYITISEEIVEDAMRSCTKKIFDTIYLTLTDHVYAVCERYKEGICLKNELYFEIKRLYRQEFEVGQRAVALLNQTFQMNLLADEAAFIAFHIVNSELNDETIMTDMVEVTCLIQQIVNLTSEGLGYSLDESSYNYDRFVTHLKNLAKRILAGEVQPDDGDDELFFTMCMKNPQAYTCIKKIKRLLVKQYSYDLSNEEQFYLLIHITRLKKDIENN